MFVGHVATGLALKRVSCEVNTGALVLAAMLLDGLLWVFVLLGLEHVVVPPDFSRRHYFTFVFPYSHGLAASLTWSLVAFGVTWLAMRRAGRWRVKAGVAVALALALELVIALVGTIIYLRTVPLRPWPCMAFLLMMAVIATATVVGMTGSAPSPDVSHLAWTSIMVVLVIALLGWLLERGQKARRRDVH